ncbi:hypothetical protein [Actinomycetospora sp. CA-053990]|uniref:hypothetical protein n=1 Tax=Actinomycetospora sp. CA-053990 TaxID=3239891 RepID=UPI003D93EDA1
MPCDPVPLDPGHDDPGAGRCLTEHVSMLAGEAFRAWPRCTHPAVATLATRVEDHCSPEGRAAVLRRAEALVVADSDDPALTWRLVGVAAETVLTRRPGERVATRRLARARRHRRVRGALVPRALVRRLPRWVRAARGLAALDELVAALHYVVAVSGPPSSPERDIVLVALLDAALDEVLDESRPAPTPSPARLETAA